MAESSHTGTVLITGGTSGLGYYAALEIARLHPEYLIIISARSDPSSAASTINKTLSQKNTTFLPLDLSSLPSVRAFASAFSTASYPPIVALLQNAGLQFPGTLEKNADGIEKTFAIAHLGHALLFALLRDQLASTARIVITSSGTHDPAQKSGLPDAIYTTAEEIARPDPATATPEGRQRYATAKLVNVLWTYALNRRLATSKPQTQTVVAFDPGLMPGTGLAREASAFLRVLWIHVLPRIIPLLRLVISPNIHTPRESGANLARLAVGDDVKGITGVYFEGDHEIKSSKDSYNEVDQEELWTWTLKNIAVNDEELKRFEGLE
jgi:NAD(P)-dependent dehydrogenase (short-subunit alcohol dehydrogenase family)